MIDTSLDNQTLLCFDPDSCHVHMSAAAHRLHNIMQMVKKENDDQIIKYPKIRYQI